MEKNYRKFTHCYDTFVIWEDGEEFYCCRGGAVGFFTTFAERQKYMLRTNNVFGPMPLTHISAKAKREGNEQKIRDTKEDLSLDAEMSFYVFEKAGLV